MAEVRSRAGSVLGLRIPADGARRVTLRVLRLSASELSDAVGGGLPEDTPMCDADGAGYTFYLDGHRVAKGLRLNDRAAVLSARLGHVSRAWLADLRGDVLVLGADGHLEDVAVPRVVLEAAARSGLMVQRVEVGW
jgi:hypothetical protein